MTMTGYFETHQTSNIVKEERSKTVFYFNLSFPRRRFSYTRNFPKDTHETNSEESEKYKEKRKEIEKLRNILIKQQKHLSHRAVVWNNYYTTDCFLEEINIKWTFKWVKRGKSAGCLVTNKGKTSHGA
jgi:hypothetical protein